MSQIKIADIAKMAKVSPATVTRVIHNNGYVSEEKRALVQKVIDDLGYVPNRIAIGLRRNESNFIGHVLPHSNVNPLFAQIGSHFDEAATNAGYHVLTGVTQMDPVREKIMIEDFVGLMVEAIVFTTETSADASLIKWILSCGIPVVMIERPKPIDNIDIILLDHYNATRMATEHMILHGHQHIGFIGKEFNGRINPIEYDRFQGYSDTLSNHGLSEAPEHISFVPDYTVEYGKKAMSAIIASGNLPTALLATSDVLACGVLQALYEHNLRVPDDISLVGFDNTLSALSTPPLTSIDLQSEQIGIAAVDMIMERKNGKRIGSKTITLSPVLIDRGSVKTL